MADTILNCQTCGGALKFDADGLHAVCPYCGNEFHFKSRKGEALSLALNRANLMRRSCDFDGAITEYKLILSDDGEDAEANWGLALSIYGIEYVEDSRTGKLIPTCRRTVRQSILENEFYLDAVKYADAGQANAYTAQAKVIDRLQRDIKRRMDEEEDFDVFLCYRSADSNGAPTRERIIARRIYDELSSRKIKTFFSEVTLKDRLGDDYEPIIYKALYSCKFFILIATSEENINAPWVKNEWSRFRDRQAEEGLNGACCAVFEGIPSSCLPAFLRSVQGINLAKYPAGGYEIELADNLCTRLGYAPKHENRTIKIDYNKPKELAAMLELAQISLDDEVYGAALEDYEKVLSQYPKCGEAWWGCFLASRKANTAALAAQNTDYDAALTLKTDRYLRNAERFCDDGLRETINLYKKMCAYRCGELAEDCYRRAEDCEREIAAGNAELEEIAAKKKEAADKREKLAKTGSSQGYKKRMRAINLAFAVGLVMFMFLTAMETELVIMLLMEIFAWISLAVIMKSRYKKDSAKVEELGRQVSGYYAREQAIISNNNMLRDSAEKERHKASVFKNVFR